MKKSLIFNVVLVVACVATFAAARYLRRQLVSVDVSLTGEVIDSALHWGYPCVANYRLRVTAPPHMRRDSDAEVLIAYEEFREKNCRSIEQGHVDLQLKSGSFSVVPTDGVKLPMTKEAKGRFSITPQAEGERNLILTFTFVKPLGQPGLGLDTRYAGSRMIKIFVESPSAILGLSEMTLKRVETVATIIGLPGIVLLLLTIVFSKRRDSAPQD